MTPGRTPAQDGPADPAALAELAGLLADRTRAAFCLALIDGRAWTAGELARYAGVAPSTAGEHLTRLVDAGFLATERQGRHRYLRLADDRTAGLVETIVEHLGGPPPPTGDGWPAAGTAARSSSPTPAVPSCGTGSASSWRPPRTGRGPTPLPVPRRDAAQRAMEIDNSR